MADISIPTASLVAPVMLEKCIIVSQIAAATITQGQWVYTDSNGKANLADANGSGTLQVLGCVTKGGAAGQEVSVLTDGFLAGFDVSAQAFYAPLYLSNTAGAIADAAGGSSICVGRVVSCSDADPANSNKPSKLIRVKQLTNVVNA